MEYNTSRSKLQLPEYGRNIQQLVEHCKNLITKDERNQMAIAIIEFMAQRSPHLKNETNYKDKLWDHLYILSNYDLDVDPPHPFPTKEELNQKPHKMAYPSLDNEYKFYGKSILQLIDRAIELENREEKEALIRVIANNMKKSYNVYNREHVQDDVIFRHLKELSNNRLDITCISSLERSIIYPNAKGNKSQQNQNKKRRTNSQPLRHRRK